MRAIRFRAWDSSNMIYQESIQGDNIIDGDISVIVGFDNHAYLLKEDEHGEKRIIESGELIPMQFTGLYDRRNSEVYEGDILQAHNAEDRVVIEFKGGQFVGINTNKEHLVQETQNRNWLQWDIIGNIHENPELIK